jgi:SAM-dependent methyltransferase
MLCGSQGVSLYGDLRDRLYSARGRWALLRCPKDGLVWIDAQPVTEETGKIYAEYSTHTITNSIDLPLGRLRKAIRNGILSAAFGYDGLKTNRAEMALGWVLSRFSPLRDSVGGMVMWLKAGWCGKLLDVGCGNGQMAAYLREMGWDVTGVEPDPTAARLAEEQCGLKVYQGTLEEAKLGAESFDAISMQHVIEHVPDPLSTLRECQRVLKPGGRLVIITPNLESLASRVFKDAWLWLDPPRHYTLFSAHTLRSIVEQARFEVTNLDAVVRNASTVWVGSQIIQQKGILPGGTLGQLGWDLRLAGWGSILIEYCLNILQDAGDELVLIADKK